MTCHRQSKGESQPGAVAKWTYPITSQTCHYRWALPQLQAMKASRSQSPPSMHRPFSQLVRSTRCGSESDHLVAFVLRSFADGGKRSGFSSPRYAFKAHDLVMARQDLLHPTALAWAQVRVTPLNLLPGLRAYQRAILALSLLHFRHVVAFVLNHPFGSEGAAWRFVLNFDEVT